MGSELDLSHDPEMRALRESTIDLIKSRPYQIQLIRKGKYQRTPEGGQARTVPAVPQKPLARYFAGTTGAPILFEGTNGEQISASYVLIGDWGDDIEKYDEFELFGKRYVVVGIDDASRGYQTKAWCAQT